MLSPFRTLSRGSVTAAADRTGSSECATDAPATHLLTVNVEDYFQTAAFRRYIGHNTWYRFEVRLQQNVETVLDLLGQHHVKATFFVLGWIADRYPEVVRLITDTGHEVASRGYLHQRLVDLPRDEVRTDLTRSRRILEDVTGTAVTGFRLSDGWIGREDLWLLDEIAAAGYRYDSSLMPRRREFRHEPVRRQIHRMETEQGDLVEVPLTTTQLPFGWLPIAGGNYLRQLPETMMQRLVDHEIQQSRQPYVMYFHTWELDPEQPQLSVAGRLTKLRHYRNLDRYQRLLPQYLKRYEFTSIRQHSALAGSPLAALEQPVEPPPRNRIPVPAKPASRDRQTGTQPQLVPLTVVIPCLNEESSLRYLANTLESVREDLVQRYYRMKLLFVDDGSTDNTYARLQELYGNEPDVQIVRHDHNQGVSAAIFTGLKAADTDIVCSMDCDCSYDPHELGPMLERLGEQTDLVTASPYHRDGLVRNVPGWRLVLSRGLSFLYQLLLNNDLATWTSCFRVYRRNRILKLPLQEKGFLGTAELAAQLVMNGGRITEYPTTLETRLFGVSKMKTLQTMVRHLRLYLRIASLRMRNRTSVFHDQPIPLVGPRSS